MKKFTINYIGFMGTTGASVINFLRDLKEEDIIAYINSNGGEVFDGFTIYNVLKSYIGRVSIIINGLAVGISSVVAMAGDEILMTPKSYIVTKNPCMYNSDESTYSSIILDKIKSQIIDIYMTRKLSISRETISKMMDNETFIDYTDALKYGFIDRVID